MQRTRGWIWQQQQRDPRWDAVARWLADLRIERLHRGGGRCPECAAKGGCMAMLGAMRRLMDRRGQVRTL